MTTAGGIIPRTIERYTLKNGGAVAGPKQMLGQHMFRRLHTRTEWDNLLCCGESTVMGTGTPTVTTSGLTAANVLLKKLGKEPFVYREGMTNYVRTVGKPFTASMLFDYVDPAIREIMLKAMRCRLCEHPSCAGGDPADIRGLMRRVSVGNFTGARKCLLKTPVQSNDLERYEMNCIRSIEENEPVRIREVITYLVK